MKRILKGMAETAKKTAKASVNSASFFSMHQPKEPDVLKKKEKKQCSITMIILMTPEARMKKK